MLRTILMALCLVTSLCCSPALAGGKVVLASLEWPPYTGAALLHQGATSAVVRAAFKAVGYDVEIRFLPWNRAVEAARFDDEVVAYFPEYPNEIRGKDFLCSNRIGKSPLGFAERRARGIDWFEYGDLKRLVIGVVDGYVNTRQFDEMVASGEIETDRSMSDLFNLRKVLAGRVDYGVIDMNVYEYLLHSDPMLYSRRGELRFDSRLLGINDLVVCFRSGPDGAALRDRFNEGLATIRPRLLQGEVLETILDALEE